MDILDNATIVKNLSDPKSLGNVWSMARGLIGTVEFTEQVWDIARKHPNTLFSLSDEDSFNNWCMLWDSFEKQWREDLAYLNLDDLDRWLVNDSKDIVELEFRLNKVKCRTGKLWNLEEASKLHTEILHITDRLADIILNLRRNAYMSMYDLEDTINFAHHGACRMVKKVCKWIEDVMEIQKRMQTIINGAEQILNPQPDTTTEQEQTVRRSPITDDKEIKEIFDEAVNRKFMSYTDKGIKWLRGNPLLAYFCVKLSTYRNLSEKTYEDKDNDATNWSVFGGIFLTKRQGGKWELADATKLHDYKFGNMKGKTEFHPKGYEEIDDLILEFS